MTDPDRPLTDPQERLLLALDSDERRWRAWRILRDPITDHRFRLTTVSAVRRLGFVEAKQTGPVLLVRITDAGVALLRSMGD